MNKDFDDFLKTLDEDTIMKITDEINNQNIGFNFDAANTQEYFKNIFTATSALSMKLSIRLLELYHNWLKAD